MRVGVVEVGDEAQVNLVVLCVIHERTARRAALSERPAQPVNDLAFLMQFGLDLPNLFDANPVVLGVFSFVETKMRDELFAEVATTAFCKERVLGV